MKRFFLLVLSAITLTVCCLAAFSCGEASEQNDGEFFLRWGVYGQSSYDSKTGTLVKTTAVEKREPSEYEANLILSKEQRTTVYEILNSLGINDYPDVYDPYMAEDGSSMYSSPSVTITLIFDGKTINCPNIAIGGEATTEQGKKFISAVRGIIDLLTSTKEWSALPDYEVMYY